MEKEEIIKKFKEKGFNEETIDLLLGAIEDFEAIKFDRYIPIKEVVDRICKNLNQNVKYVDFEGSTCGRFRNEEGEILISEDIKDKPETLKSVFFHEFTHCITYFKELDMVGFHTIIKDIMDTEDDRHEGYGLNEGVTSYIERKRNAQRNYSGINSYPILNSLVENIMMIVGEKELLYTYFNEPERLEDLLMSKGISNDIAVIDGFDEVKHHERKVIETKRFNKSNAGKIAMVIFGEENQEEKDIYAEIGKSVDLINDELFGAIESSKTIEDFEKLTKFIARLDGQKFGIDKNKIYGRLLKDQKNLVKKGIAEEDLEKIIDDCKVREQVDTQKDFESINSDDKEEFLIKLYEGFAGEGQVENETIFDILNEPSYNHFIIEKLFNRENLPVQAQDIIAFGKILKDHPEILIDDVSISVYKEFHFEAYLVADSQGNKFFFNNDSDICRISEDNIGKGYNKWEDEEYEVKFDDNFSSVTITKDGEETVYPLRERILSNFEMDLQHLNKILKGCEERLARLEELGAPDVIIENEKELIEKCKTNIEEKKKELFERKNKKIVESSEMETFEGKLEDVEKADKKKEVMQATIKLIKEQENNRQNIDDE